MTTVSSLENTVNTAMLSSLRTCLITAYKHTRLCIITPKCTMTSLNHSDCLPAWLLEGWGQWDESSRQTFNCMVQIVSAALSRVSGLHVAEVNLIRRSAAGPPGRRQSVRPVSPSLCVSDFGLLPSRCSECSPSSPPPAACCLSEAAFYFCRSLSFVNGSQKNKLYCPLTSAAFPPAKDCAR